MNIKLFILLLLAAACAPAAIITLSALNSGSYADNGTLVFSNNYAAGWFGAATNPPNIELRDYFVFDLASVNGTIASATLRLQIGSPAFLSTDSSETFSLFDVSTAIATLTGNSGGLAAFNDLGTGISYGSVVVPSSISGFVEVSLNAAGISYLQSQSGQIALGGALTSLARGAGNEALFNATGVNSTRELVIRTSETVTVPEPASYLLGACGIAATLLLRRRQEC